MTLPSVLSHACWYVLSNRTPTSCISAPATACAVPFLLDLAKALRAAGPVPGRVVHNCLRIVVGVAAVVCGGAATDIQTDIRRRNIDVAADAPGFGRWQPCPGCSYLTGLCCVCL